MAYFHCLIGGGSSGGGYELTVTCDSAFAGTTITCTDGVTTLTKTCPSASPYEVEFDIPNGGDWTISGVVSGQTITTGVSIPTTAELIAYVQKTITIYSAKEDTITYTDVYGDTQTEVFASGQTSKQITIDINLNGSSITFTSGVAKDPSDLTAYYSKTVTITDNTTDVYLMPDNALYWYGWQSNDLIVGTENTSEVYSGSYSSIAPTYNTNSISLTLGSQGYYESYIYALNIIGDTTKCIASATRSDLGWLYASSVIPFNMGSSSGRLVEVIGTTKQVYTVDSTSNKKSICIRSAYYVGSVTVDAFWVE